MRLLLDTHVLLWFVEGNAQLSAMARALIEDPANEKLISMASLWELAIKVSAGKLTLAPDYDHWLTNIASNGFALLPIETRHLSEVSRLPFHHRDPFDRLLIAQSHSENLPLISADAAFDAYGVRRLFG